MLIYFLGCLVSLGITLGFLKHTESKVVVRDLGPIALLTLFSWVGALFVTCLGGSYVFDKLMKKHGDKELL